MQMSMATTFTVVKATTSSEARVGLMICMVTKETMKSTEMKEMTRFGAEKAMTDCMVV